MNCKTKFDNNNKQAIEYEGHPPKSNSDLKFGGRELREDPENKEKEGKNLIEDTADKWVTQREVIGAVIGASWIGVNIFLNEPSGRSWISRVAQERAIIKYRIGIQGNS